MRQIIEVEWMDHCQNDGQISNHEAVTLAKQETVGYFVYEDDDVLKLCMGFTDDHDLNSTLVIDKKMLVRKRTIRRRAG